MRSYLLSILLLFCLNVGAQTILLNSEDFESLNPNALLNIGTGTNQWIINNQYNGSLPYPKTIDESHTVSGNIFQAPHSRYLHIYDSNSSSTNCNFNPNSPSDQSAIVGGVCTMNMTNVHFTFFYLCEGSNNAHGEIDYSTDGGATWIPVGAPQYSNQSNWKYEDITDPGFNNVNYLLFAFHWVNSSGVSTYTEAWGIDDIFIVGDYNASGTSITVTNITPLQVCPGETVTVTFKISNPMCDGVYLVYLSDAAGSIDPNSYNTYSFISYPFTQGTATVTIPTSAQPGSCYKIRVDNYSNGGPYPSITGIESDCFAIVNNCLDSITSVPFKPLVLKDNNTVCTGSKIILQFLSFGVYNSFNTYTAQLSDSSGNFPAFPQTIGTNNSSQTFSGPPGTVSGSIPETPAGCNYYFRVVSNNPPVVGKPYGPFCIQHCDINTNDRQSFSICLTPNDKGFDTLLPIKIHVYDSIAVYTPAPPPPGNQFELELKSMKDFSRVGTLGALGTVTSVGDTMIHIHIPPIVSPPDSLENILGIALGMYYARFVATESNPAGNSLGTIIFFTIGAALDNPPSIVALPGDTICTSDAISFIVSGPGHPHQGSTYNWTSSSLGNFPDDQNGFYGSFSGLPSGSYSIAIQENSFGCAGAGSDVHTIVVKGPPDVYISGPNPDCQTDTALYSVPFDYDNNTYYRWAWTGGPMPPDTSNNFIHLYCGNAGNFELSIFALNSCGTSSGLKDITVNPSPQGKVVPADTSLCANESLALKAPSGSGYKYSWFTSNDNTVISTEPSLTLKPDVSVSYLVKVTTNLNCSVVDTSRLRVATTTDSSTIGTVCPLTQTTLHADYANATSYHWSNGASTPAITIKDTGIYVALVRTPPDGCVRITFKYEEELCDDTLLLANVFTPNKDGVNDYFVPVITGPFETFHITIFNRWGELIFESNDYKFQWDGTNTHHDKVADGTYYWVCETSYKGNGKQRKGFVTLVSEK